jgi:hypothetical protein
MRQRTLALPAAKKIHPIRQTRATMSPMSSPNANLTETARAKIAKGARDTDRKPSGVDRERIEAPVVGIARDDA